MKRPQAKKASPRFTLWVLAQVLALHGQGVSLRDIADDPKIRKGDGSKASQQAIQKIVKKHSKKRRGKNFVPNMGAGDGGGRPSLLTEKDKKKMEGILKKERFRRTLRAPWLKRKAKVKGSRWTVRRALTSMGYKLHPKERQSFASHP